MGGLQETASAGQRLINSTLYVTLIGDLTAAMILYLFYRKDQCSGVGAPACIMTSFHAMLEAP